MIKAYILVKTDPGGSEDGIGRIRELDVVEEAHVVAGEFDIIAEVTAEEVHDVLMTASSNVQDIEGVAETRTYIALD